MNKNLIFVKGLTLIELLVVMSIISLLSSIVIASLKTTRARAADVAVVKEVRQMSNLMAINFVEKNSYEQLYSNPTWADTGTTPCDTFPTGANASNQRSNMVEICKSIVSKISGNSEKVYIGPPNTTYAGTYGSKFTIIARLPSSTNKYVCLGSNGGFTNNQVAALAGNWMDNLSGDGCWNDSNI